MAGSGAAKPPKAAGKRPKAAAGKPRTAGGKGPGATRKPRAGQPSTRPAQAGSKPAAKAKASRAAPPRPAPPIRDPAARTASEADDASAPSTAQRGADGKGLESPDSWPRPTAMPLWPPMPAATAWPPSDAAAAPAETLHLRPSLLAAVSSFAKVAGYVLLVVAAPTLVALLAGRSGLLAAVLLAELSFLALLPAMAAVLVPAVRIAFTRYELDADGVRVHSSLIARSDQRVPWEKVTLLVQRRGLADRVLGISSLDVVAYGTRGATLHLVGLRDPRPVREWASARMREAASVEALFRND